MFRYTPHNRVPIIVLKRKPKKPLRHATNSVSCLCLSNWQYSEIIDSCRRITKMLYDDLKKKKK